MSLLSKNVIPGGHGKLFGTNALETIDMERIKNMVCKVEGVKDVLIVEDVFPKEFIVHTSKLVAVSAIEDVVKHLGFNAIPRGFFKL